MGYTGGVLYTKNPAGYTPFIGKACSGRNEIGLWSSGYDTQACADACSATASCVSTEQHQSSYGDCAASTSCTPFIATEYVEYVLYAKVPVGYRAISAKACDGRNEVVSAASGYTWQSCADACSA